MAENNPVRRGLVPVIGPGQSSAEATLFINELQPSFTSPLSHASTGGDIARAMGTGVDGQTAWIQVTAEYERQMDIEKDPDEAAFQAKLPGILGLASG